MTDLHPEAMQNVGDFLAEIINLVGKRLKKAVARVSDPRAGSNCMADVDVLVVVDELSTREIYRIWNLAGSASIKHNMIFSVLPYSTRDFENRKNLPVLASFLAVGIEYDIQ